MFQEDFGRDETEQELGEAVRGRVAGKKTLDHVATDEIKYWSICE